MITDYISWRTACVYGIYGHLGGGKTLTSVDIMLHALSKRNATVVSNVKLRNLSAEYQDRYMYIDDFAEICSTTDETKGVWSLPQGSPRGSGGNKRVVIVLDEVAEFFDQYSSSSSTLKTFLSWLRHTSKRGQWVFLIVQQPEFIAKGLRKLVNYWVLCDDMEQYRLPVARVKIPFLGNYVRRLLIDRHGNVVSRGLNLCCKTYVGHFYDTSQSIALLGRTNEQEDFTPYTPPYSKLFTILLIIYLIVLWLVWA